MKPALLTYAALLACSLPVFGDLTGVNALWSDTFEFDRAITDNEGNPLEGGDVVQIGFFAGVDPAKDPRVYSEEDWASFRPLTGNGSPNGSVFAHGIDAFFLGFLSLTVQFDTDLHVGIPTTDVRIGLRFFDAPTVADATFSNTVTSGLEGWIMQAPGTGSAVPPLAEASMDEAHQANQLTWEGAAFKTNLDPPVTEVPDLLLTDVRRASATSLLVFWAGGDGSNNVQTSVDGVTFENVLSDASSPALLTIDPENVSTLFVRVVEP